MKKYLLSFTLLVSTVSCGQTEIETPLYEQPRRRVNAQQLGTYVGSVDASGVYNNPAMAQYAVPGQSLSAIGQGGYNPQNVNGQLGPWSYMPAPSPATLSGAPVSGPVAGQGGVPVNAIIPPQLNNPQFGNQFGGQFNVGQQQMPSPMPTMQPPVQYGSPPIPGGGMNSYGGEPQMQIPTPQPPFPPQPYNNDPYGQQGSSIDMPKLNSDPYTPLREGDYDFSEEDADDLFSFFQQEENSGQQISEGGYDLEQGELADISEVQDVDVRQVILPQSEMSYSSQQPSFLPQQQISYQAQYQPQREFTQRFQQAQITTQQQPQYIQRVPQQFVTEVYQRNIPRLNYQPAQQQIQFSPAPIAMNSQYDSYSAYNTPKSFQVSSPNARQNVRGIRQSVNTSYKPVNSAANNRKFASISTRQITSQGRIKNLSGWKKSPAVKSRNINSNYSRLSTQSYNNRNNIRPKSLSIPRRLGAANYNISRQQQRVQKSTRPTILRYKEDYAPLRQPTNGYTKTWYPKSMTRI